MIKMVMSIKMVMGMVIIMVTLIITEMEIITGMEIDDKLTSTGLALVVPLKITKISF